MENYNELKNYPVMVKPADSNSSNGVKKALNSSELKKYAMDALEISRNGKVVVEEFFCGREINVYCYVSEGKVKILATNERICVEDGRKKSLKCFAGIIPADLSTDISDELKDIADGMAKAFKLDNTPFFFQTIIGDKGIKVLEGAPRSGGGVSYFTIRETTGFDIISASIDSYLEKKTDLSVWHEPDSVLAVNTIYCKSGIFDRIEGMDSLVDEGLVMQYVPYKTKGMKFDEDSPSAGRVGAFIVKGKSKDEILDKVRTVYDRTEVYDENGCRIMRKDLNLCNYPEKVNIRSFV